MHTAEFYGILYAKPWKGGDYTDIEQPFYPEEQRENISSLKMASNLIACFLILLIFFNCAAGLAYVPLRSFLSGHFGEGSVTYYTVEDAAGIVLYSLSFLIPLAVVMPICKKAGYIPRILFGTSFRNSAPAAILASVGIIGVFGIISDGILTVLEKTGIRIYEYEEVRPDTPLRIVLFFISTVIIPAFVEELVFRGFVLHLLLPYGKVPAIIVSGVLFGMMHAYLPQLLYAAAAGILIGYFVIREGSVWIGIFIHLTNNLISFLYDMAYQFLSENACFFVTTLIQGAVYLTAFAGIIILFRNTSKHEEQQYDTASTYTRPLDTGLALKTMFTVPMLLYLLFLRLIRS